MVVIEDWTEGLKVDIFTRHRHFTYTFEPSRYERDP